MKPLSNFRPDIEGLRALAVISVIINHFSEDILPSGYLGVDIFFVISGFVITSSLFNRSDKNLFDFLTYFYMRRIKRLVPALVVCVGLTSVLVCLVDPDPSVSLKTGIASLFGVSNIYLFSLATDYYAPSTELNVFTQTWSLGVEEQFYLFFPLLMWFFIIIKESSYRVIELSSYKLNKFLFILLSLLILSLIGFVYFNKDNQPAAYFLMPNRLWELGVGALLFVITSSRSTSIKTRFSDRISLLLFILLLAVFFAPVQAAVTATIFAVIITMLLIKFLRPGDIAYKLITYKPIIFIGTISYSLYLWHWSILSLSRWTIGIGWWTLPIQVCLMFLLAYASFKYLETPLRRSEWSTVRWKTIGYGISSCIGAAFIGVFLLSYRSYFFINQETSITYYPAFLPVKNSSYPYNPTCVVDNDKRTLKADTFENCTILPKKNDGHTIWTFGDSHAGHLQGLLYAIYDEFGLGVHLIETPGLQFPLSPSSKKSDIYKSREIIFNKVNEKLHSGDIILISRLFINRKDLKPRILPGWDEEVVRLAELLDKKGVNLVIFGPPPIFTFDNIKKCKLYGFGNTSCDIQRDSLVDSISSVYSSLKNIEKKASNVFVFNYIG